MQEASTETSRAAVASFFRALRAGDMDAFRAAFAPDATWILRGGLPASGTWTGPDGIMDGFFPRIFGRLDPEVPVVQDVHRIIANGEYAVAEWTTHARTRDGRRYESDYAGVFRVVSGQLAAVTEYLVASSTSRSDVAASAAARSPIGNLHARRLQRSCVATGPLILVRSGRP